MSTVGDLLTKMKVKDGMGFIAGRCGACGDPGNYRIVRHGICEPCWDLMVAVVEAEALGLSSREKGGQ